MNANGKNRALQRRPSQPQPSMPRCRCGGEPRYGWQQMKNGRWHIRVECDGCGLFLQFAPQVEPYMTYADRNASGAAILDVLVQCEELGIELLSDGQTVRFHDNHRAPPGLRSLLRQCSHDLARLMGRQ
jgi:hypothetical protein